MLKNYLKGHLRNFTKNRGLSVINVVSLALGMACCLAIATWVQEELSYDRFHANTDQLFRVWVQWDKDGEVNRSSLTSELLGAALQEEVPGIVNTTRLIERGKQFIRYGGQSYFNEELLLADPAFLEMFSFPLVRGDKNSAMTDKFSVIISESMAGKYFGDKNPLGEILTIDRRDYTVTAVMKDVPANSHLKFDCLASFDSRSDFLKELTKKWDVSAYYTYVQLRKDAPVKSVADQATAIQTRNAPDSEYSFTLNLQPITQIHLHHDIVDYIDGHGDIFYVYLFSSLAVLMLIVAGINYMNLTTARATARAREIGLRKAIGASRSNLITQFFGETLVNTLLAGLLAVVIVEAFLPVLSQWSGKQLHFNPVTDITMLLTAVAVVIVTAGLAGSYPAFILSSFLPIKVLKGRTDANPSGVLFRRILVAAQFVASIVLIAGTCTIQSQLGYIRDKELGFNGDNLMYLDMRGKFREHYVSIKEELLSDPSVMSVTSGRPPIEGFNSAFDLQVGGKQMPDEIKISRSPVDANYVEAMGMEIVQGSSFLSESDGGMKSGFILNETAVAALGPDVGLGSHISFNGHNQNLEVVRFEGDVIGIVKDYHNRPLHSRINPVIMYYGPDERYDLCVRSKPGMERQAIAAVDRLWQTYTPEYAFEYHFVDETLKDFYKSEHRLRGMFDVFTILAIVISCLGLIGLASHAADRRIKEIGIRRVLGATASDIVRLMSTEFISLVAVASLMAVPAAWYITDRWLEQFVYRVDLSWGLFLLPVLLTMIMAVSTAGVQAVRATRVNPTESLKHE